MVSAQWFPTGRMGVYEGLMVRLVAGGWVPPPL